MSEKFTPGPWAVNTAGTGDSKGRIVIDEIYVYAPDSGADDVAVAADIVDPLTGQPSKANARLIAVAPKLLEALEASPSIEHTLPLGEICECSQCHFVRLRDAAIAKATGVKS